MARELPSHLVILGHPGPESFCSALARCYVEAATSNHHEVVLRDLYAVGFDPLLKESERRPDGVSDSSEDIAYEYELLQRCDVLVFVYPLWFGMPPAIIKGYIDRVMGRGFRIADLGGGSGGMLRGKRLAVITTSGSRITWLEEQGMWISLRQSFDRYLTKVFGFSGFDHYHADSIGDNLGEADANRTFFEVTEFARNICACAAVRTPA